MLTRKSGNVVTEKQFMQALNAKISAIIKQIDFMLKEKNMTWDDMTKKIGATKMGLKTELFYGAGFRDIVRLEFVFGEDVLTTPIEHEKQLANDPQELARLFWIAVRRKVKEEYNNACAEKNAVLRFFKLKWNMCYFDRKWIKEYVRFAIADLIAIFKPTHEVEWDDNWAMK